MSLGSFSVPNCELCSSAVPRFGRHLLNIDELVHHFNAYVVQLVLVFWRNLLNIDELGLNFGDPMRAM